MFLSGSEHYRMPRVLSYSVHMGRMSSRYLRLTVESMKRNPEVEFVLINIAVDTSPETGPTSRAIRFSRFAPNFNVVVVSVEEFKKRCKMKLNIDLPITDETAYVKRYAYKIAEFKPALALLFPEQFKLRDTSGKGFAFWGYTDLDLIWGNISHFAQQFQGQYACVSTNSVRLMGMATFYVNEEWTKKYVAVLLFFTGLLNIIVSHFYFRRIVLTDKTYLRNLNDFEHHYCSDEFGQCLMPAFDHSMHRMVQMELNKRERVWNMPSYQLKNKMYVEEESSIEYYGPVLWFQGSLKILNGCGEYELQQSIFEWSKTAQGCPEFEPGREIMYFHRVSKSFDIFSVLPVVIAKDVIADMLTYGFLLPNLIPLFSRHICPEFRGRSMGTMDMMTQYSPFSCYSKNTNFSRTLGRERSVENEPRR